MTNIPFSFFNHTASHRTAMRTLLVIGLLWNLLPALHAKETQRYIPKDYVWTTHSRNSSESMHVVAMTWV